MHSDWSLALAWPLAIPRKGNLFFLNMACNWFSSTIIHYGFKNEFESVKIIAKKNSIIWHIGWESRLVAGNEAGGMKLLMLFETSP